MQGCSSSCLVPCLVHHRPKRSKQETLFDLFRGASTSREHDADHDSQSVTEVADDRTNGDSESLSSSASDF